jgi:hypothetical protein
MIRLSKTRFASMLLVLIAMMTWTASAGADYPPGNPPDTVAPGETGELIDYELAVVDVDFDAKTRLHAHDRSDRAISDVAYVMIQIEATYTGDSVGRPAEDMSYTLSDADGYFYDLPDHACPAWPIPPEHIALRPGETARFNLCFVMPYHAIAAETGSAPELTVFTNLITDQWPVTFALDAPGQSTPTPATPCSCAPPEDTGTA